MVPDPAVAWQGRHHRVDPVALHRRKPDRHPV